MNTHLIVFLSTNKLSKFDFVLNLTPHNQKQEEHYGSTQS